MKLQKMLFYTQSWHLKLCDGRPLFDDLFARWKFGPVIPPIYHLLKKYGSNEIQTRLITNIVNTPVLIVEKYDTEQLDLYHYKSR